MSKSFQPGRPRKPAKTKRDEDGWELIGFYFQSSGVVDMRDREIALALKPRWLTSSGVGDSDRVKRTREHVTKTSRRENERGVTGEARTFSGWQFAYRDIKGSPTIMIDGSGSMLDPQKGIAALLGDNVRLEQHSSERERMAGFYRQAATEATGQGNVPLAVCYLDCEHDIKTFGQLQDVTVERLKQLLAASP